jgi:hypothetical protein
MNLIDAAKQAKERKIMQRMAVGLSLRIST